MTIAALRTPEARFATLPDWPYAPRYVEDLPGFEGLRMAYYDEGPSDASHTFLCLHGEPSWSYLYRKMIPVFLASGARVVAFDHFGFGRSDKPIADAVYTWRFHRQAMLAFIARQNLDNLTLVVQDWGGLLGLTIPVAMPERVKRLLVMNTAFATGARPSPGFMAWKDYAARTPDMPVGSLIARGTPHLTEQEIAAYDAPFPDARYKAGVRRFPQLVPVSDDPDSAEAREVSREAVAWWAGFKGLSFMAVGDADPVLGPEVMEAVRRCIRGCPEPLMIRGGGHFVQEWGEEIAKAALARFGDV